jgi:hypothetical protein
MSIYLIYSDEYNEDEFDYFDEEKQAREAVDSTKELLKKEIDEPTNF